VEEAFKFNVETTSNLSIEMQLLVEEAGNNHNGEKVVMYQAEETFKLNVETISWILF
jgi:hypothetical protein